MAEKIPSSIKKEISRLRSEVRKLQDARNQISAFSGLATGNYWTSTGMPWVGGEGRKAVLTEYFWQPIRGQPRRVDTNELRQFAQDFWVSACVKTIVDEIASLEWDIVPKEDYEYEWVEEDIKEIKEFLKYPNKNNEPFNYLLRALMKDILEIDAGVLVKVFDIDSYNFDEIEPKSGAPTLKPKGQRKMTEIYVRDGASFLKEIDKFGFEAGFWQYSYQIPAHPMWFNKDEIVYCMEHPRSMSCYGYARTQAVLDIVKSLHYSTLYNKRFFEESPIPDGALSLLDTNEVEMRQFMTYWNNEFKAQPHKVAVTNKDLKWQPFAVSQRELEFLETQKWYFNIIISMFGLTPAELGITDNLNRATSATQAELVKRKGIRPFLKLLESYINKGVISEFNTDGVEFQFIYDDPSEKKQRLDNWNLELSMGVKTINEVRDELGLEPIPNGDVSNNMNMLLAGGMQNENNQNNQENTKETTQEESQSPGYKETLNREEANNGKAQKGTTKRISTLKSADTFEFKNDGEAKEILRSSIASELSAISLYENMANKVTDEKLKKILLDIAQEEKVHVGEFQLLLDNLDKENAPSIEEGKQEAQDKLKKKDYKGIDDGQYYRDQPISQPRRPSGADNQPQNRLNQRTGQRDGTGPFKNNPDCPKNLINCPICGQPTLSSLNSLEQFEDDLRCTNCGARFKAEELLAAPMMEEVANAQQQEYITELQNSVWKSSEFKKGDSDLDIKSYCGFDVSKSFPYSSKYAKRQSYKNKLLKYLKDMSENKVEDIIDVLIDSLKGTDTIFQISEKINEIINDPVRAQLIARTEVIRLANEGNLERMEEKDQKLVKFISAPEDGRLCKKCKEKDGKIYSVKNAHGVIPIHPRCRCTFTEYEEL